MNRAVAPRDPWAETIKTLLLVYGVLLIACFVAPWSVGATTTFSWTMLKAAGAAAKMLPLFIIGTGVIAIALGAIPMVSLVRGIITALIGAAPLLALTAIPSFDWRGLVSVLGTGLIVVGLLVRSKYTKNALGRLLTTIGILAVLALYLIPRGGDLGLVITFKALGSQPIQPAAILGVGFSGFGLVPLVLTVLALLVWLPGPGGGGSSILAWVVILSGVLTSLAALLMGENILDTLKTSLLIVVYLPVAMSAWLAFIGYGGATLAGKQLEAG